MTLLVTCVLIEKQIVLNYFCKVALGRYFIFNSESCQGLTHFINFIPFFKIFQITRVYKLSFKGIVSTFQWKATKRLDLGNRKK